MLCGNLNEKQVTKIYLLLFLHSFSSTDMALNAFQKSSWGHVLALSVIYSIIHNWSLAAHLQESLIT